MNSKRKGNVGELYFAKMFTETFGKVFRCVPASGAHGTILAGTDIRQDAKEILSGDLICPPDFKFSVEIKTRANFNFWWLLKCEEDSDFDNWIVQAKQEAEISKKDFLLIIKVNNRQPFAVFENPHCDLTNNTRFNIRYKNYYVARLDYFLKLPPEVFF